MISLRDGIKSNPKNWNNCTMFVQDVVMPGLNIAAEIPEEEAMNFKIMCKMFAKYKPTNNNKSIDIPKVVMDRSTSIEQVENVFSLIDKEIAKACNASRLESREGFEEEIVSILTEYLTGPKAVLEIIPFGSSRYGFKRLNTNFNLLINTSTLMTSFLKICCIILNVSNILRRWPETTGN